LKEEIGTKVMKISKTALTICFLFLFVFFGLCLLPSREVNQSMKSRFKKNIYYLAKTPRTQRGFIRLPILSFAIFASLQEEKNCLNRSEINRDRDLKAGSFLCHFFDHFVLIVITPD
jgi:hypothetical protein